MSLFQRGEFTLHSGQVSDYRINCEALDLNDWDALAHIIKARIPAFGAVYGVPRGGLPLQKALAPFATGNEEDPLLICDDVYTSGSSMREAKEQVRWKGGVCGVVVFARKPIREPWVKAVFTWTL
jgi:orotate phosphoribosyltransferase